MKTIKTKEVRRILRKQYPKLKHIWLFEPKWVLLPGKQVQDILHGLNAREHQFKKRLFECDAFAMTANAEVKKIIADLDLSYSWAFWQAAVAYPRKGIHNQNIFINEHHEVKLFEPQRNSITNPDNGIVFFVGG